jgi:hypothetical protein
VATMPQRHTAQPIPRHRITRLNALLERFTPIGLAEMDGVALLNRVDTKYLLDARQCAALLRALAGEYRILDIDGVRLNAYQTLYFDTADFALYYRHHAGGANRFKVRSRHYLNTHRSFFEVKHKTNHGRTMKHRVETPMFVGDAASIDRAFLEAIVPAALRDLRPTLWNTFGRVTLVGTTRPERVTLDFDLDLATEQAYVALPRLVVAEVKQARADTTSPFVRCLAAARQRPASISKYCLGVALLYPQVKHNNFKPTLRAIQALQKEH